MPDEQDKQERGGFLARLNALETVVLAAILLVALAGLMLVGKGFFLKAQGERSHDLLSAYFPSTDARSAERRLY